MLNSSFGFLVVDATVFGSQNLSANQISSTYFNSWLRYNYFRFGKINVRHIGILLPVSLSVISPQSACYSIHRCNFK